MSQQQSTSLLWINKDASNVHRKKHVAEVNAHVQKSNAKKKPPKRSIGLRKPILPARKLLGDEQPQRSPGLSSSSSCTDNESVAVDTSCPDSHTVSSNPVSRSSSVSIDSTSSALIFSSYVEDGILPVPDGPSEEDEDLSLAFQLAQLPSQLKMSLPPSIDASNPLPGFLSELSSHDKMLIHTHLTYMPQMYYGLSSSPAYCPIRNASVINMLRAPVGVMWVLISIEMFLETMRKSNARKAVILRRKNQAYKLMSKSFSGLSETNEDTLLLGSKAAAIAELFCGDPAKALTHLNGIHAFMAARGGIEYVKQMDISISMPTFAVSAYRAILQDNLTTAELFHRARVSFLNTMRSIITWNNELTNNPFSGRQATPHASPQDEGFDGRYDLVEGLAELRVAREKAFFHNDLLRKFVYPDFDTDRLGEKADHFILLYNINRAIIEHGTNLKQAALFIDGFVDDVEASGSTRTADSSIKLSGVLRLFTHRQCKMYPHQPSNGVAHAWAALDALEIMNLLPSNVQQTVRQTLHLLLLGQTSGAMTEQELPMLESVLTAEWLSRHPDLSLSSG